MLIKLKKSDYHIVSKLIHSNYLSVQLESVIKGHNPGEIFVQSDKAESAIVYHQGENGFYFIGKPDVNFIKLVKSNMESMITLSDGSFEFSGDSTYWEKPFKQILEIKPSNQCIQEIYIASNLCEFKSSHSNIEIQKINSKHFDNSIYQNTAELKETVLSWWHSIDDYLKESIGYVAVDHNKIIARCILDGRSNEYMAIGIAVDEQYRNKGIASSLATMTVNQIIKLGHKVYWECTNTNEGSKALTAIAGLDFLLSYKVYWL